VIIDVIALRPSLPCTAADHPGAWCEWIMWTTQVHNCPRVVHTTCVAMAGVHGNMDITCHF